MDHMSTQRLTPRRMMSLSLAASPVVIAACGAVALLASSWSHRSRIGGLPGLRAIEKFDIGSNRLLALLDADDPYSFGRAVEAHTVDLFVPHVHEGKPGRPLRWAVRPAATE
jgi:hypothetical protein